MEEYKIELKQVVDYPRCRMYRQFIRSLIDNEMLRVGGTSGLYYYTVLSCFANFRTSHHRVKGVTYTVYPGEWICRVEEIMKWFRVRRKRQAISIMEKLQEKHLLKFKIVRQGDMIKYRLSGWAKYNRILEYNAPCQKDTGFFFMPVHIAAELVGSGRNSEMDALIDMWIHTVYNDPQVKGSENVPVVYMRNGTGSPLIGYAELAERWGVSKATAGRYMKKLSELGHVKLMTYPGTYGSVISLQEYMSTMFQVSNLMVDKEEIAMSLCIKLKTNEAEEEVKTDSVSEPANSVSNLHVETVVSKIKFFLNAQGFFCPDCSRYWYMLLELSDCKGSRKDKVISIGERYQFTLSCGPNRELFRFEISVKPAETRETPVKRE